MCERDGAKMCWERRGETLMDGQPGDRETQRERESAVDIFRRQSLCEVLLSDGLSLPMNHQPLGALF